MEGIACVKRPMFTEKNDAAVLSADDTSLSSMPARRYQGSGRTPEDKLTGGKMSKVWQCV